MAPTFINSSHSFVLTSNIFRTISITRPCIPSHTFLIYTILTPSNPGADLSVSFITSFISSLSGSTFKHLFPSFALLLFLKSTAALTALSITSGLSSYLSFETLSKYSLNSSTVSCKLLTAGLSLVPRRLKHLYIPPILVLALTSTHSSITPLHRSHSNLLRNLSNSFLSPSIFPSPSQPPLLIVPFPFLLSTSSHSAYSSLTLTVIPLIPSSISLSFPIVLLLATPLLFRPYTFSAVFTSTFATSLHPHSSSPQPSHLCLVFS